MEEQSEIQEDGREALYQTYILHEKVLEYNCVHVGLTSADAQVTDTMASGLILFQREPLRSSNRHMGTESESWALA